MSAAVIDQLVLAGLFPYCTQMQSEGGCLYFVLDELGREALRHDTRFASGALHGLHRDIGDHRADYRSYNSTFGPGSLQVVFDKITGKAYADIDKHNPYQDVVQWMGHAFGEVVPHWFKKKHKA